MPGRSPRRSCRAAPHASSSVASVVVSIRLCRGLPPLPAELPPLPATSSRRADIKFYTKSIGFIAMTVKGRRYEREDEVGNGHGGGVAGNGRAVHGHATGARASDGQAANAGPANGHGANAGPGNG